MTESERDQIDEDAQDLIKSCSNAIYKLKETGIYIKKRAQFF